MPFELYQSIREKNKHQYTQVKGLFDYPNSAAVNIVDMSNFYQLMNGHNYQNDILETLKKYSQN
jgi:hypothetical protein